MYLFVLSLHCVDMKSEYCTGLRRKDKYRRPAIEGVYKQGLLGHKLYVRWFLYRVFMTIYIWKQLKPMSFQHNTSSILKDASRVEKQCGRKKLNVLILSQLIIAASWSLHILTIYTSSFAESITNRGLYMYISFLGEVTFSVIPLTWEDLGSSFLRQLLLKWVEYVCCFL